jgi:phage gpG-like protein
MAGFFSLAEGAARMIAAGVALEVAKKAALEEACILVETRAKDLIGVPQGSWPPLAAETLRQKGGVNTPLLESGEMRSSIEHTVQGSSGFVGSNSDIAVFQELGTSRGIPPRSFLGLAAQQSGPDVAKIVAQTVGAAIAGGLAGRGIGEILEARA